MKQYQAVQSADGMRLEEVNPYEKYKLSLLNNRFLNKEWEEFESTKQSFLTDDPTVVAGEKYEAEDYELVEQKKGLLGWVDVKFSNVELFAQHNPTRQILRRKAEGESIAQCDTCQGHGWLPIGADDSGTCPICNGTGSVEEEGENTKSNNMKTGMELIAEERQRQIKKEGWTPDHDAQHKKNELALAAVCYALPRNFLVQPETIGMIEQVHLEKHMWPFDWDFWKPTPNDRVRDLVKAGALIAAEIDRIKSV